MHFICSFQVYFQWVKSSLRNTVIFTLCSIFIYKTAVYQAPSRAALTSDEASCRVCYLLNLDGMKGLGHSALLLIDEEGNGQLFSYNGMQYNLFWCLMGKEGIGKMKNIQMDPEETSAFLETGRPVLSEEESKEYQECTDFDRILYRYISSEQYEHILDGTKQYIETGNQYEALYASLHAASGQPEAQANDIEKQMDLLLCQEQTPKYQIYTHNCDTAARELIARTDEGMALYNRSAARLTPSANYRAMCRMLDETWGYGILGEDTLTEKLLQ